MKKTNWRLRTELTGDGDLDKLEMAKCYLFEKIDGKMQGDIKKQSNKNDKKKRRKRKAKTRI
jgi:hypothetical protein